METEALIMASATPTPYEGGKSCSALEQRGIRRVQRRAESPQVADAVIEAVEAESQKRPFGETGPCFHREYCLAHKISRLLPESIYSKALITSSS